MEIGSQKLGEVVSRQADLIVALKKEQSANKYQSTCTEKLRKVVAIRKLKKAAFWTVVSLVDLNILSS